MLEELVRIRFSHGAAPTLCATRQLRYNSAVTSKKGVIRVESLNDSGVSRNRTVCGFFVRAPVLAARVGGRKPAGLAPLSPVFQSCSSCRPCLKASALVFKTDRLEHYMTNTITPFNFGSHTVRVVMRDGSPWFIAKDVCDTLEYKNTSDAVATHLDDDERYSQSLERGGSQVLINESGLYALVLRSRKPEARKFAKWVTSEVLPAIRKTGSYSAQTAIAAPQTPKLAPAPLPNPNISVDRAKLAAIYEDLGKLRSRINGLGMLDSDLPPSWWDAQRISTPHEQEKAR